MKKSMVILALSATMMTLIGCQKDATINSEAETMESESEVSTLESNEAAKLSTGIPNSINIFTVIDNDVPPSEFDKISKWYTEKGQIQTFRLFKGDEFVGERKHARTEAGTARLKFKEGSDWYVFEAKMRLNRTIGQTYTIAQLFAGCCGPQLRVEVKSNGRIHVGSRSNGNRRISSDANWTNDGNGAVKRFRIKIRTNGKRFEVYFNGSRKFTGTTEESMNGNKKALYHFRWGVYANDKLTEDKLFNTVSEVVLGKE